MATEDATFVPIPVAPFRFEGAIPPTQARFLLGVGAVQYRMRGFDQDGCGNRIVYWTAPIVDFAASRYIGPGPVWNIVVSKIKGT